MKSQGEQTMYFYSGNRGGRGQDVWREIESASRDAVNRLRELFENVAHEGGSPGDRTSTKGGPWRPNGDLLEDASHYYARVEIPGTTKDLIEVLWKGEGVIMIRGTRPVESEEGKVLLNSTRPSGPYEYTIRFPDEARLDDESISARYTDGVLTISVAKSGQTGTTISVE
jgi:HSP20 family molecular chaperone IbpA